MFFHLDIKIINLIHILFQGTLFIYIGLMKQNTSIYAYYLLLLLTLLILFLVPLPNLKVTYWNSIKISHYLIFLPLLLYLSYLGIYKKKISNNIYDLLFVLGVFVILYHSYKLYQRLIK
jgi:hypothetical protein